MSPLHSRGSPTPSAGMKIISGYFCGAFLGAQKRAQMLRNPYIWGAPNTKRGNLNKKCLSHPYLLKGPNVGEI